MVRLPARVRDWFLQRVHTDPKTHQASCPLSPECPFPDSTAAAYLRCPICLNNVRTDGCVASLSYCQQYYFAQTTRQQSSINGMQKYVLKNEPIISFCYLQLIVTQRIVHLTNYPKPIKCTQQRPCSEANMFSPSQEIMLWRQKFKPFKSQPRVPLCASRIHSTITHLIPSRLPSHLAYLHSGLFPSGFPIVSILSIICATYPAHLTLLDLIARIFGVE